jgi:predicted nucleic acid-binding protein
LTRFVIDASIVVAWLLPDEIEPYADDVASALARTSAVSSGAFGAEVCNALLMAERRQRIDTRYTGVALLRLGGLPIEIQITASNRHEPTLALSRTHGLTYYDAAYLDLALIHGLPIATLDDALRTATTNSGCPLFEPTSL